VDEGGCPHITNFGLTRLRRAYDQNTEREIFRNRPGTVHFQAPELLSSQGFGIQGHEAEPTTMSDMYALAMTSVQIVTGALPYGYTMSDEMVKATVSADIRPEVPNRRSKLYNGCWDAIEGAWARSPHDRIDSHAFSAAFARYLSCITHGSVS